MLAFLLSLLPRISSRLDLSIRCHQLQACQEDLLPPLPRHPSNPLSSSRTKVPVLMAFLASLPLVLLVPAQANGALVDLLQAVLLLLRSIPRCLTVVLVHLHKSQTTRLLTIEPCNRTPALW